MDISKLIGRVQRDPPKEVHELTQQLLLRSGNFLWTENEIIILEGGNRILENLITLLSSFYEASQRIEFGCSFERLLQSEFNSYRSLPACFHTVEEVHRAGYAPLGMLYPKLQPALIVYALQKETEAPITLFKQIGLEVSSVEALGGEAFFVEESIGRDLVLKCEKCGYEALQMAAKLKKDGVKTEAETLSEVATPNCQTIVKVAAFIGVKTWQTAKAVFYHGEAPEGSKVIFVAIRGDLEVNEEKLKHIAGINSIRPAEDEEIRKIGAVPGYASPIGIDRSKCIVVADDSLITTSNLVAGANKEGYHFLNCNYPRDFQADLEGDVALASEGSKCINCGNILRLTKGIVIGKKTMQKNSPVSFIDEKGKPRPIVWHNMSFNLFSIVACVAQKSYDKFGIVFPPILAPWKFIVLSLNKDRLPHDKTHLVTQALKNCKQSFLLDARQLKAGQKFMEADLRGIPFRIVLSDKDPKSFEIKNRMTGEVETISIEDFEKVIKTLFPE